MNLRNWIFEVAHHLKIMLSFMRIMAVHLVRHIYKIEPDKISILEEMTVELVKDFPSQSGIGCNEFNWHLS